MTIIPPFRLAFWRFVCAFSAALSFFSIDQVLGSAHQLGVDLSLSKPWLGLVALLTVVGLFSLLCLITTWSRYRDRILAYAEFPERISSHWHWVSLLVLTLALAGYSVVFMFPFIQKFFGGMGWVRFLIFWFFSLIGIGGIKLFRRETTWFFALITIVLCQSTL